MLIEICFWLERGCRFNVKFAWGLSVAVDFIKGSMSFEICFWLERGGRFQEVRFSMLFEICFWLERGCRFQEVRFSMLIEICFWLAARGLLGARFCNEVVKELQ